MGTDSPWMNRSDEEQVRYLERLIAGRDQRIAALEAREAELVGALKAAAPFVSEVYWNECEDFDATCDSCLAVRARKMVDAALRQESPDA